MYIWIYSSLAVGTFLKVAVSGGPVEPDEIGKMSDFIFRAQRAQRAQPIAIWVIINIICKYIIDKSIYSTNGPGMKRRG